MQIYYDLMNNEIVKFNLARYTLSVRLKANNIWALIFDNCVSFKISCIRFIVIQGMKLEQMGLKKIKS